MSRGRPRSEQVDRKLALATLQELDDRGYAGMSIGGIAKRAGIGKATIYRRFNGKADLVTAAIASQKPESLVPREGSARERLTAMLAATQKRMLDDGYIKTLLQILAESERNPELLELHRERTITGRRDEAIAIMQDGAEAGELRADADFELVFELLAGSWMARYAFADDQPDHRAEQVIDMIWPAIAAPE